MSESLVGQKFGRLTVIHKKGLTKYGYQKYLCKCVCGEEKEIESQSLTSGRTQSCGCLQKERVLSSLEHYLEKNQKEGTLLSSLNAKKSKNNTSGFKGVTKNKRNGKWIAQIAFKRKNIYLGEFVDIQDAVNARKQAEEKYFKPILEKYDERN